MDFNTWANSKSTEVIIIKTAKGKKFYMLADDGDGSMENNYIIHSDTAGRPLMWSRKADMIEYAKKKKLYLVPGYHSIGMRTMGRSPPWF